MAAVAAQCPQGGPGLDTGHIDKNCYAAVTPVAVTVAVDAVAVFVYGVVLGAAPPSDRGEVDELVHMLGLVGNGRVACVCYGLGMAVPAVEAVQQAESRVGGVVRSEEHTSELQSRGHLV